MRLTDTGERVTGPYSKAYAHHLTATYARLLTETGLTRWWGVASVPVAPGSAVYEVRLHRRVETPSDPPSDDVIALLTANTPIKP